MSAPLRSLSLKSSSPIVCQRPDCCQISAGLTTGYSISWQPIDSISSRMTASILRMTRQPAGRKTYTPAASCRTSPARTMSLWLTASAPAGSSLTVGSSS